MIKVENGIIKVLHPDLYETHYINRKTAIEVFKLLRSKKEYEDGLCNETRLLRCEGKISYVNEEAIDAIIYFYRPKESMGRIYFFPLNQHSKRHEFIDAIIKAIKELPDSKLKTTS